MLRRLGTLRRMPTTRIPVVIDVRGQRITVELTYAERRDLFRALEGQPVARPASAPACFALAGLPPAPALARSA